MIPIRDQNITRRTPVINYLLIALNVIFFLFQFTLSEQGIMNLALIPAQVTDGLSLGDLLDFFTCIFMHAGLLHIAGNMLYLWIFGDNIEDTLGHARYLLFYLGGGVVASLVHIGTNPDSVIPTVGASGAIAAVLGAYIVLFPRAGVVTLLPLGFLMRVTTLPAVVILGFWFILQLFSGVLSLGGPDMGGTAFWAHIGGFVFGVLCALILPKRRTSPANITW